ncbi:MAG TPA: hypothetical protein VLR88_03710, partial [Propionibacteriaceae bacterium]|nr:hypothetical protein [Propionibacteriaceae bacterium]
MDVTRGGVLLGLALAAVVTGCGPQQVTPAPSSSTTPSASASPTVTLDLLDPGAARTVVSQLRAAAGDYGIIKVDVEATTARLAVVADGVARTYAWTDGVITEIESDIEYVQQATFNPDDYGFDNIATMFADAAKISGSSSNQELQIVEYNEGRVMMTVTTRPESMPVFFRADGTPIDQLDLTSAAGLDAAIADTTDGVREVLAMGYSTGDGFWVDIPGSVEGQIDRRTRAAKLPAWTATRKETTSLVPYQVSKVDPEVIATLLTVLPTRVGKDGAKPSFA